MRTVPLWIAVLAWGCTDVSSDPGATPGPSAPDAAAPMPDAAPIPDAPPPADVEVKITGDNGYGFGYGTSAGLANYFGGEEATTAGQIFNCSEGPETYLVPGEDANAGGYLYIVAWADKSTSQGVLGQFRRVGSDEVTYTGTDEWEVCATGIDYQPGSGGPDLQIVNDSIAECNAGAGSPVTTSAGWVDATGSAVGRLQTGEDNTTPRTTPVPGNEFPITCGIDDAARWMWYAWDIEMVWPMESPFLWPGGSDNTDKQFLIFRLGADFVVE